ncbi:MAG: precorrin-8X methylmutase [Thermoleophilia bacterium]
MSTVDPAMGTEKAGAPEPAAVVILGHGSRAPEAAGLLDWVAGRLAVDAGLPVMAASLQFNQPTLADCCRRLAAAGARRILIAPYFLFEGNHMQRDIPGELDGLRAELDGVDLVLTAPLGADERLVEVIRSRIAEAGGARQQEKEQHQEKVLSQNPIEKQSFEIIDALLGITGSNEPEYQVVRRVIHATGDLSLADALVFSSGAMAMAVAALAKKANIVCDVNMAAAGIEPTANRLGYRLDCAVTAPGVARMAQDENITRSAAGIRQLARSRRLDDAVIAIGNAPTALWEVLRLERQEGVRPALVIGVPVGFVGAAESKQALAESDIPHVTLPGNRGGTSIAVAIVNALMRLSAAG